MTRLLREADESGTVIVTGLEMFIGQACGQFEKFTGLPGKTILINMDFRTSNFLCYFRLFSATGFSCAFAGPKELFRQILEG